MNDISSWFLLDSYQNLSTFIGGQNGNSQEAV